MLLNSSLASMRQSSEEIWKLLTSITGIRVIAVGTQIHTGPMLPAFNRASDRTSQTPSSQVHTHRGVSLTLRYSGATEMI